MKTYSDNVKKKKKIHVKQSRFNMRLSNIYKKQQVIIHYRQIDLNVILNIPFRDPDLIPQRVMSLLD